MPLNRAKKYLDKQDKERALIWLKKAHKNIIDEKVSNSELFLTIANFYNNISSLFIKDKDYSTTFDLLKTSINIKIKYKGSTDSIKGTFQNMFVPSILTCNYDEIDKYIEIIGKENLDQNLKNRLQEYKHQVRLVKNNLPQIVDPVFSVLSQTREKDFGRTIYLPNIFEDVHIETNITLNISDHATLNFEIELIFNNFNRENYPYENESWKIETPPNYIDKVKDKYSPNLIIFHNILFLNKDSLKIYHNNKLIEKQIISQFSEIMIPTSYPRYGLTLEDTIPNCKEFKYFRGYMDAILWDISKINKNDSFILQFELKKTSEEIKINDILFEMGIFVPFKYVKYNKVDVYRSENILIKESKLESIKYFIDKSNPSGISFDQTHNSINTVSAISLAFNKSGEHHYMINNLNKINEFDYSLVKLCFNCEIKKNSISISYYLWEHPIPVCYSHMFNITKFGFPPICMYSIANTYNKEMTLNTSTIIKPHSLEDKTQIKVLPNQNILASINPIFIDEIKNMEETQLTNMYMKIKEGSNTLLDISKQVRLLAYDTIVLEVQNPYTREIFKLNDFLACFVTPNDPEIDKVLTQIKENHADRTLSGYQGGSDDTISRNSFIQCEAIFNTLKEIGLSYVSTTLSFGWPVHFLSQRVKLPRISLQTKSANCIDGVVLFASIMEKIGLYPFLITLPGHAIVGWRPTPSSGEIILLETTAVSSTSFQEAVELGSSSLNEGMRKVGEFLNNPSISLEQAISSGYIHFIDIVSLRHEQIYPFTL